MEKKILGKRDLNLLTNGWMRKMPSGRLTKVDMEARVLKLFNQLESEDALPEYKLLAKQYLWKVLDSVKEYSH